VISFTFDIIVAASSRRSLAKNELSSLLVMKRNRDLSTQLVPLPLPNHDGRRVNTLDFCDVVIRFVYFLCFMQLAADLAIELPKIPASALEHRRLSLGLGFCLFFF